MLIESEGRWKTKQRQTPGKANSREETNQRAHV